MYKKPPKLCLGVWKRKENKIAAQHWAALVKIKRLD